MIFRRALYAELTKAVFLVFSALLAITLTTFGIRFLGQAASGAMAPGDLLAFLTFVLLNYLPIILALTLFIAVLLTLSRSYRDSEMVIWFSSGLSLAAWVRPVLFFIAPFILAIASISLWVTPWATQKNEQRLHQMDAESQLALLSPGVFRELPHADTVYFVEGISGAAATVHNVFVQSNAHGRSTIVVARDGYQKTGPDGERFLVLTGGLRYDGVPGQPAFRMMQFRQYWMRLQAAPPQPVAASTKNLASGQLLRHPTRQNIAEFQWRVSRPLVALLLVLLAIPLSFVNPRAGRSMNLIYAILIFMIYNNLLGVAQSWVESGRLAPGIGLWGVHALMLLLTVGLFYRRLALASLFGRRRA